MCEADRRIEKRAANPIPGGWVISVTRIHEKRVAVHFRTEGANPITSIPAPDVDWDLTVILDEDLQDARWEVIGQTDCFPAYEVWVSNGQVDADEAPAVGKGGDRPSNPPQVGLMNQGRRLQGVILSLPPHVESGHSPQLQVDPRNQLLGGGRRVVAGSSSLPSSHGVSTSTARAQRPTP
jgi:hypothetical protein